MHAHAPASLYACLRAALQDDEWEPLYQRTAKYMEVEKRVSVLNHRLDIIADLFDMLASEMHQKHASNLEIIIIVLIMIGARKNRK